MDRFIMQVWNDMSKLYIFLMFLVNYPQHILRQHIAYCLAQHSYKYFWFQSHRVSQRKYTYSKNRFVL